MPLLRRLPVLVPVVAAAKVAVGVAAFGAAVLGVSGGWTPLHLLYLAHVATFAASGAVLLAGGRRDERAQLLGVVLLLVASVFADSVMVVQRGATGPLLTIARGVMALQVDAFMPWFLWRFVRAFPVVVESATVERRLGRFVRASLALGVLLFAANVALPVGRAIPELAPLVAPLAWLARTGHGPVYWALQFTLVIAAFPALAWKTRWAPVAERRRVRLLVAALLAGTAPTIVWVLLQALVPPARALLPLSVAGWVAYPALLSTPAMIAWAVLVRRALDVALVVRRALQYALARGTVVGLSAVPVVFLLVSTWRQRDASVAELATSPRQLLLVALAGAGVLALRRRGRVLARLDARFFRQQYDAGVILKELVARCRTARDHAHLAQVIREGIDRALHLESASVLFPDPVTGAFVSPADEARPLAASSALARALAACDVVLDVDLERPDAPPARRATPGATPATLGERDRLWLADGAFQLLLPLRDASRALVGIIALGTKKSELPWTAEDVALLAAVGHAAELTLAFHGTRARSVTDEDRAAMAYVAERCAVECIACGVVQPPETAFCARCGAKVIEAMLPQVVGGKFLVDVRVGAGGMGVVYRAMDVQLGRPVAIKTLPRVSPEEAMRLRREARAAASVAHPNLALIFGAETWQGRPMLVFEFLAGGTLADRLKDGPLPVAAALDATIAIADALDAIHRSRVVHGDVKPSNIGFTADGEAKLLDFGLARLVGTRAAEATAPAAHPRVLDVRMTDTLSSGTYGSSASGSTIRGTPLYMSPEALAGELPDPAFDLWSLAMVLYEAVAGENPYVLTDATVADRLEGHARIPALDEQVPAPLRRWIARALADDAHERPRRAAEVADALRAIRAGLGAPSLPAPRVRELAR